MLAQCDVNVVREVSRSRAAGSDALNPGKVVVMESVVDAMCIILDLLMVCGQSTLCVPELLSKPISDGHRNYTVFLSA